MRGRSFRDCFTALAGLVALALAAGAEAQESRGSAAITLPLKFAGFYEGDISVKFGLQGDVAVDAERLIALLGERLSASAAAKLRAEKSPDGTVPLGSLAAFGIIADYDPATLEISVSIPIEQQGAQQLAAQEAAATEGARATIEPAGFAATAIVAAKQRYRWGSGSSRGGFDPIDIASDIAANIGGTGGLSMFGSLGFGGGDGGGLERGDILAVHDDTERAIRYAAGDIAPAVAGFQTAPLIGGVSIGRQYGTIQPFRNIRPSGQYGFVLDRPATVELIVNGAVLRTIRLEAGQYNLRDFPFVNGLNRVEFYQIDGSTRRLLASFSQYFSGRLLERGIFDFGLTAGVLENVGASAGSRYSNGRGAVSGFARYGISDSFMLGANIQASTNQAMVGLEAALATPIGAFAGLAAASTRDGMGRGWAALIGYEASFQRIGPIERPQFNLEAQAISRAFSPLALRPQFNRQSLIAQGRFSGQLPAGFGIGLSASRFVGRDGEPDQTRYALSLGKRIGRLNITATYEQIDSRGPLAQRRGLLTISLPLGRRGAVRGSYDTSSNLSTLEFSRFKADEVGALGLRGVIARGGDNITGSGEIDYNANRFGALFEHNLVTERDLGAVTSQESTLTVSSQVALANGRIAFGRPVGPRFALVAAHPTLEGAQVEVRQGRGREAAQGKTDRFGPALAPAGNAYTASELQFEVERLPPGYDLGDSRYVVVPSPAAGYLITVGSDASRTVLGTAVKPDGTPISLEGGQLIAADQSKSEPILLFTNRAGRFSGNGLSPGTYELRLGKNGRYRATLTIPAKARGVVDIGKIVVSFEDDQP